MKILLSNPDLAPELVDALNRADCVATRIESDTVEVLVPWLSDGTDATQAATELRFFLGVWGSAYPDVRATVLDTI